MSVKKSVVRQEVPLKGFKITLSFKDDATITDDRMIVGYLKKNSAMYHVVAEHGSNAKRHLHCLFCTDKPRTKRGLQDTLWKKFKPNHEDCIQKFAVRVDVLYDDRWIKEYLSKEATAKVVSSNYDPTKESEYYATPEQQATLQGLVGNTAAVDTFYSELYTKFQEWYKVKYGIDVYSPTEVTRLKCLQFLLDRMFVEKNMRVIRDPRIQNQIAVALYRFVTGDSNPDYEQRKYMASLDGPVMNFEG